jgi:hypothetical protein
LGNAIRVKDDQPQVIKPALVVVREGLANGGERYHAVAGQRTLKDWARTQASTSRFDVVGLLMPKAAGTNPIEYPQGEGAKLHVSTEDLKGMAGSALQLLQGLARHGFIHGDIKPENLIWDPETKTLQLIDNDNLQKVSKNKQAEVAKGVGVQTVIYTNPVAWADNYSDEEPGDKARLGLGRDLFAVGMVLLEASLLAKGEGTKADALMNGITFGTAPNVKAAIWEIRNKGYTNGLNALKGETFGKGSVEDFARSCILKSVAYEEARSQQGIATFERYDPKGPADDQHLLAQLQREFAQLR